LVLACAAASPDVIVAVAVGAGGLDFDFGRPTSVVAEAIAIRTGLADVVRYRKLIWI
jgi:hypothetical protein